METRSANEFNEAKTEHRNEFHLWQSNIGWYDCIVEVYKLMEKQILPRHRVCHLRQIASIQFCIDYLVLNLQMYLLLILAASLV